MKVLLISTNTETINMPVFPLGLASVAQVVAQAGHQVEWLDLMGQPDIDRLIRKTIEKYNPEIIGVSIRNVDDQSMKDPAFFLPAVRDMVRLCKDLSDAPIVAGGAGYSIFPEACLEYINADMGIKGEGEYAFPELLARMEKNSPLSGTPGLYLPEEGIQAPSHFEKNLDIYSLPDPGRSSTSAYEGDMFLIPVQTRRGCPIGCGYCSTSGIEGSLVRKRSPENIVGWLRAWVEKGFGRFQFVDNTFNLPRDYARELCSNITGASLNIKWRSILYPGLLDEELAGLMAEAGCDEVSLGFESGNDEILADMNKGFSSDAVLRTINILLRNNIKVMGFLLLGWPGETRETVMRSLDFAESSGVNSLKITSGIRIYPGTSLAEIAVRQGVVEKKDNLLFPRFYLAEGLEGWVENAVKERAGRHSSWIV